MIIKVENIDVIKTLKKPDKYFFRSYEKIDNEYVFVYYYTNLEHIKFWYVGGHFWRKI